jgi:hypothetical protein
VTRHCTTRSLDLASREAAATDRLQAVFAEADLVSASRNAGIPALLLLAVFTPGWL